MSREFFSFPEISLWLDESDYNTVRDLIDSAASLAGDGQGGELGNNSEYERGMAELILRVMGWSSNHLDEVIASIHTIAKAKQ